MLRVLLDWLVWDTGRMMESGERDMEVGISDMDRLADVGFRMIEWLFCNLPHIRVRLSSYHLMNPGSSWGRIKRQ